MCCVLYSSGIGLTRVEQCRCIGGALSVLPQGGEGRETIGQH